MKTETKNTQIIDGLTYPFNEYRDRNKDFSPYVILPCKDAIKIRVYNYDNNGHYILTAPNNGKLFEVGTEVICFTMRSQLESERNHGHFRRLLKEKDPSRFIIERHSNQTDYGVWYKMEGEKRLFNINYCWQIESVKFA